MTDFPKLIPGTLGKDSFVSMPVDAPYVQPPPFYFRNARAMSIAYATDEDAAAALLPEGLLLAVPATAVLMIANYSESTFGPYNEALLGIPCVWEGQPNLYVPHIAVTSPEALVGGREIWGFPKKMAAVEFRQDGAVIEGSVTRPAGARIVSAMMRPEQPIDPPPPLSGTITLRVIPNPTAGEPPSLAELIRAPATDVVAHETWAGPASINFDVLSAFDPWHALPVTQVLGAVYERWDFTMPSGEVILTY